jgi:hypothetical protein
MEIMKNGSKLKGTNISISDDLTPTARAQKKVILKCASDARKSGHNVKVRSNAIIVNDIFVPYTELVKPNWQNILLKEDEFVGSSAQMERKRQRTNTSSPPDNANKETKHSNDKFGSHTSRIQGNVMPSPPQQNEGGENRPRSSSRGKRGK